MRLLSTLCGSRAAAEPFKKVDNLGFFEDVKRPVAERVSYGKNEYAGTVTVYYSSTAWGRPVPLNPSMHGVVERFSVEDFEQWIKPTLITRRQLRRASCAKELVEE